MLWWCEEWRCWLDRLKSPCDDRNNGWPYNGWDGLNDVLLRRLLLRRLNLLSPIPLANSSSRRDSVVARNLLLLFSLALLRSEVWPNTENICSHVFGLTENCMVLSLAFYYHASSIWAVTPKLSFGEK